MISQRRARAPAATRPDILLAAALPFELQPFARRLGLQAPTGAISHGKHGARHVSLIAAGMGRPGDDAFTAALHDLQPAAVVNVGIAGALDEHHPAGSIWIVDAWRRAEPPYEPAAYGDEGLGQELADALAAAGLAYGRALAVTVDEPLHDAARRNALRDACGVQLVEMEGAAWADIARRAGVPFAAVRAVSDHANRPLPGPLPEVVGRRAWLLREDGTPRMGRFLWALLRSRAWLRPRHHLAEIRAAGGQFRLATAALEEVATALLPATQLTGSNR